MESRITNAARKADLFDRLAEQKKLRVWAHQRPENVLVVVGQRSSGKTTLLKARAGLWRGRSQTRVGSGWNHHESCLGCQS